MRSLLKCSVASHSGHNLLHSVQLSDRSNAVSTLQAVHLAPGASSGKGAGIYQELRVRRVVADSLGVALEELVREVSLRDDLATDSLDLVELALALEAKFGISVPERVVDWVRSYKDLVETTVDLIRARRAAESRSAEQPARFVARVAPSEGRSGGILERGGWLTPYTVETIADDALRAGRGARLEVTVAASTEDTGLARVRDDFACLGERGILVTVWREDENGVPEQHPPVAGGATITARPPLTSELLNRLTGVPTAVTITEYSGEDPWQAEDLIACTGKDDRRFGDATPAEQTQALSGRGPYQFVESERGVAGDRATTGDHHVHAHIHNNGQAPAGSVHVTEERPPRLEIGRGSAWNKQYYQTDWGTRLGPNGEVLARRDATYYEREDRIIVTAGCMTPLAAGQPSARGQGLRMQFDLSAPSPNGFHLLTTTLGRSSEDDSCNLLVLVSAQLAGERRFAHVVVHGGSAPKIDVSLLAA